METHKGQLSHDESRRCVDSCVAVNVGRTTVQQSQRRDSSAWRKSRRFYFRLIYVISSFVASHFVILLCLRLEEILESYGFTKLDLTYVIGDVSDYVQYLSLSSLPHVWMLVKSFSPPPETPPETPRFETPCCYEEIEYGSGFIIADRMVVTCKHVVQEALNDKTIHIHILNVAIGELPCEVVHCDAANDLALLYCQDLDLQQHGISPLALSEKALWPSIPIFTFGFPITHTGKSALYADGKVSGWKERYGREDFMVLNGFFNNGNSGGPVFCRIDNAVKVVGVVAQKHIKEFLSLEENIMFAEKQRSLQNVSINHLSNHLWKVVLAKIHDALNGSHAQFGYANAVPGYLLVKFVNSAKNKLK